MDRNQKQSIQFHFKWLVLYVGSVGLRHANALFVEPLFMGVASKAAVARACVDWSNWKILHIIWFYMIMSMVFRLMFGKVNHPPVPTKNIHFAPQKKKTRLIVLWTRENRQTSIQKNEENRNEPIDIFFRAAIFVYLKIFFVVFEFRAIFIAIETNKKRKSNTLKKCTTKNLIVLVLAQLYNCLDKIAGPQKNTPICASKHVINNALHTVLILLRLDWLRINHRKFDPNSVGQTWYEPIGNGTINLVRAVLAVLLIQWQCPLWRLCLLPCSRKRQSVLLLQSSAQTHIIFLMSLVPTFCDVK